MRSISRRLLICLTLLLLLSFGAMIVVIEGRFRVLAERSLREQLDAQLVGLIAAAESDATGRIVPHLPDPESQLAVPRSGLYAAVMEGGQVLWRSPSAVGSVEDFGPSQAPGTRQFRFTVDARGKPLAALSRGLRWEDAGSLTIVVASDLTSYNDTLSKFRRGLAGGFIAVAVLLLAALAVLLRWVLAPLRRLEKQIHAVERGDLEQLDGRRWPTELTGVVTNLNTLLAAERTRISRYRDMLGNLAHSLKTPLSVLRATFAPGGVADGNARVVDEQVGRMTAIIEHQLRRAVAGGASGIGQQAIEVLPLAQELRRALLKAHGRKDFAIELAIAPELQFIGDRDDFTEALGNLMDNACKWCRERVRVAGTLRDGVGASLRLQLVIEDDGPGIAVADRERVLQRGARADEHTPGHGLGLAMVRDMAAQYGGRLALEESPLGGCRVELALPGRVK
jgi:two-component system sensor histidine kinase PhoQ